jgi:hypothetical protein
MKMKTIYPLILVLFIAAGALSAVEAQTAGTKATFSGVVLDQIKTPIPYAQVFVISREGNAFRAWTDSDGKYRIEAEAGVYTLIASCESVRCNGYKSFEAEKLALMRGENKTFDITMSIKPPVNSPIVVPGPAENYTAVAGHVYDGYGAVIPGAKITFTGDKGWVRTVKPDQGDASFSIRLVSDAIQSGLAGKYYSVRVEAPGFETLTLDKYFVPIMGKEMRLDIALRVEAVKAAAYKADVSKP